MKAFRTGHYFLALFFTGFLTGILIVNYIWGEQLSLIGTFTEVYLMRLKNEKISFQQYIWYLIQVRGIFFLMLFLAMGIRIRKNCGSVFSSVDWDVRRNFTVRGSGRIRNQGKYSLCGRTISTVPFLCSGSSCAFALLLELSTESVEQTKNVLCMRFVFDWDFFRILF